MAIDEQSLLVQRPRDGRDVQHLLAEPIRENHERARDDDPVHECRLAALAGGFGGQRLHVRVTLGAVPVLFERVREQRWHTEMIRRGVERRRRSETDRFRVAVMRMRKELGWTQNALAARLGISRRTLSTWESGYWLPPFKERLHVVLKLRDVPPQHVLEIADALGLGTDPMVQALLTPFRDALYGPDEDDAPPAAPAAPSPPPSPRPAPEQLRAAMDVVVRETADALDARPNDVRAAITRALAACEALGANLEETRAAVAALPKPGAKTPGSKA
jgi:transcriptional regulator with XRE-family HTH domain